MQGIELNGKVGLERKPAEAQSGGWGDAARLRVNRGGAGTAAQRRFAEWA
jgi:hypothetical protein